MGREKGAVFVEFLISLPLMLLVLAAVMDFGLTFKEQASIYEALRTAGRGIAARINETNIPINADPAAPDLAQLGTDIRTYVAEWLQTSGYDPDAFDVQVDTYYMLVLGDALPMMRLSVRRNTPRSFFWKATDLSYCATVSMKVRAEPALMLPDESTLPAPCGGLVP